MHKKSINIFGRVLVIEDLDKGEPKLHQLRGVELSSFWYEKIINYEN